MSIIPMNKCKKCHAVFTVMSSGGPLKCPECGSRSLKSASVIDLALKRIKVK
jgi:DNA-directed RNA polymerase subunit RPC12/RpoP